MQNISIFIAYYRIKLFAEISHRRDEWIQKLALIWANDYRNHIKELNKKIVNLEMRFLIDKFFFTNYKIEFFQKDIFHFFILESKINGEIIMNENLSNKYIYFMKTP